MDGKCLHSHQKILLMWSMNMDLSGRSNNDKMLSSGKIFNAFKPTSNLKLELGNQLSLDFMLLSMKIPSLTFTITSEHSMKMKHLDIQIQKSIV
jgi:hypothetical protein